MLRNLQKSFNFFNQKSIKNSKIKMLPEFKNAKWLKYFICLLPLFYTQGQ